MVMERQYRIALDLTQQMLSAARTQDWARLAELERQQAAIIAATAPAMPSIDPVAAQRIAGMIQEIELAHVDITEQVEVWQEHARILLRMKPPL